jgi:hypothetical protein
VGTNDLRATKNLDFIMGEVYELASTAKRNSRTADLSLAECCDVEMCHGGVLGHLMIDSTG